MTNTAALVLCVHHKPWLIMATLLTLALQRCRDVDVWVVYNVGDGSCPGKASYDEYRRLVQPGPPPATELERASYTAYDRLAREHGINPKLSAFDERLRAVTRIKWPNVHYLEFENDHALDSGVWYKFLKTGLWARYQRILCVQEGTLFTRSATIGAALAFAERRDIDFLAAGHFKRRLPRSALLHPSTREGGATPLDAFQDRMIAQTFEAFRRDPDFDRVFERWHEDIVPSTENHLPNIWGVGAWRRLRNAADSRATLPASAPKRAVASALRRQRGLFPRLGLLAAHAQVLATRLGVAVPEVQDRGDDDVIYVDCTPRRVGDVASVSECDGVRFHVAKEPEWFGVSCNHLFSRAFLERLVERLDRHRLWDALDLPFAGSALEVVWGLMPEWLGTEKWFFDGLHRVFKNPATSRREDEPPEMADYINRYFPGRIAVGWEGDLLKVRSGSPPYAQRLRSALPEAYF